MAYLVILFRCYSNPKFRRELLGPNAQNPVWHPGVGVRRCVIGAKDSEKGEPA